MRIGPSIFRRRKRAPAGITDSTEAEISSLASPGSGPGPSALARPVVGGQDVALPPVRKQDEEVADAHRAVVVQVSRAVVAVGTRAPRRKEQQQITHTDGAVTV